MSNFVEDASNKKQKEAEEKEKAKMLAEEKKKKLAVEKERKKMEEERKSEAKKALAKIIKVYSKIQGDYIKVDDVEIVKDPKGGIYGKVGDKYFYTSGKYQDLDLSTGKVRNDGNYLIIANEPKDCALTYGADPYSATHLLATNIAILKLENNKKCSFLGTDIVNNVVYEGARNEVGEDLNEYFAAHEEKRNEIYAKTITGQIKEQLQKRENKNIQTTGKR